MSRQEPMFQAFTETLLRGDEARYNLESVGFHRAIEGDACESAALARWVHAAIQLIFHHEALLACAWEEQIAQRSLEQAAKLERLEKRWIAPPPKHSAHLAEIIEARQAAFQSFWEERLSTYPVVVQESVQEALMARRARELPLFCEQLSLLRFLEPGTYRDFRIDLPLHESCVAVYRTGCYHLIPVCAQDESGRLRPTSLEEIAQFIASFEGRAPSPQVTAWEQEPLEVVLARIPRRFQQQMRRLLPAEALGGLETLRRAPILINWDLHASGDPLTELRQTCRGSNDHPLVLIRTESSMVFDWAHVLFDGMWAKQLVDLLTHLAIEVESPKPMDRDWRSRVQTLRLPSLPGLWQQIQVSSIRKHLVFEVSAEATGINLSALQAARERLAVEGVQMSVHEFLLIVRFLHAHTYRPREPAREALAEIARVQNGTELTRQIEQIWLANREHPPSILTLVDAFAQDPRLRLFMTTIRVEEISAQGVALMSEFLQGKSAASVGIQALQEMSAKLRAKITNTRQGKSMSLAAGHLLQNTPPALRTVGNWLTGQVRFLRERISGDEVFSNLGPAGEHSTVTRFTSARGHGKGHTLVWGIVLTRAEEVSITLRDFHPYVSELVRLGRADLAQRLTQDYLDEYIATGNRLLEQLTPSG